MAITLACYSLILEGGRVISYFYHICTLGDAAEFKGRTAALVAGSPGSEYTVSPGLTDLDTAL